MIRSLSHALIAMLLLALAPLMTAGPAEAQTPPAAAPAPAVSPREAADLLALIKDDARRGVFVTQLEALVAAQKKLAPEPATPSDLVGGFLLSVTDGVGAVSNGLGEAVTALADLPSVWRWLRDQGQDSRRWASFAMLVGQVALVLVVGIAAERLVARLTRPIGRRAARWTPRNWWARGRIALVCVLLDLLAVAALAGAAYLTLTLLHPDRRTQLVALALVNANLAVRVVLALARTPLAPRHGAPRLLALGDEAAAYLWVWLRRLTMIVVYGVFLFQAALLLGLGHGVVALLLRLWGLLILTLGIILVLQNRVPVAVWLSRTPETAATEPAWRRLSRRIAEFWHVIVILYLCAAYAVWAIGITDGFAWLMRVTLLSLLIAAVWRAMTDLLRRVVERGFSVGRELATDLPGLQARANSYLPLLHAVLQGLVGVIAVIMLLQVWGLDSFAWLASSTGRQLVTTLLTIGFVLLLALLVWEAVSLMIERLLAETDYAGRPLPRSTRARTLLPLLRNAVLVLEIVIVGLVVLSELGINIAPLLAGAGVIGLAIGFGAQSLVRDLITGLFILFEDSIRVGDVVDVSGKTGTVEALNIRSIKLRDARGNLLVVPFSAVSTVLNMTKDYSFYLFEIPIDIGRDPDEVARMLSEIDTEMRADPALGPALLSDAELQGVERFEAGQMILRARIKTMPGRQWAVGRAYNRQLQARLHAAGLWGKVVEPAPEPEPPAIAPPAPK